MAINNLFDISYAINMPISIKAILTNEHKENDRLQIFNFIVPISLKEENISTIYL